MAPITCVHGEFDPYAANEARSISHDSFDRLQQYSCIPDLKVCPVCVEAGFARRLAANQVDSVKRAVDLNQEEGIVMPQKWVTEWKKGTLSPGALPTDAEYSLFCHHDKPGTGRRVLVSANDLEMIMSVVGEFRVFDNTEPMCDECEMVAAKDWEVHEQWIAATKSQRKILKQLDVQPAPFGVDHYVLPLRFYERWQEWMRSPGSIPEYETDFCEHGMIDFDPMMEKVHYLTEIGWKLLCEE